MNPNVRIVNKWQGYYVEDCACIYCLFQSEETKRCTLEKCCCEEEKHDAIVHERVKRKRGSLRWDM